MQGGARSSSGLGGAGGVYLVHCPSPRCGPLLLQRKSRNETEKRERKIQTPAPRKKLPSEKQQQTHHVIWSLPALWFISRGWLINVRPLRQSPNGESWYWQHDSMAHVLEGQNGV